MNQDLLLIGDPEEHRRQPFPTDSGNKKILRAISLIYLHLSRQLKLNIPTLPLRLSSRSLCFIFLAFRSVFSGRSKHRYDRQITGLARLGLVCFETKTKLVSVPGMHVAHPPISPNHNDR